MSSPTSNVIVTDCLDDLHHVLAHILVRLCGLLDWMEIETDDPYSVYKGFSTITFL